jgi:hypothetical protein
VKLHHGAQGADDHGHDHGGAQPFSADVSDDHQSAPTGEGYDLEEVAAHFGSGAVDALDRVAVE